MQSTQSCEHERQSYRRPAYNIHEADQAYSLEVYIPGVNKSGVEVSLQEDTLSIKATQPEAPKHDGLKVHRREINQFDYCLKLDINVPIQRDAIRANVDDGVLILELPKAEETKSKKIDIN